MSAKKDNALSLVGERIRALRQSRGMTQSELAGDDVTRNMLSRIENGAALPSLPTLVAIAARLDVPVGALLGDFDSYSEQKTRAEIAALIDDGKYAEAISLCENAKTNTDGIDTLFCEAAVCRAHELYREGKLTAAYTLLSRADAAGADTSRTYVLRELIRSCGAVETESPNDATEPLRTLVFDNNDAAIYLYALKKLGDIAERPYSQPSEEAAPLLAELSPIVGALSSGFYRAHIEAKFEMLRAEYLSAKTKLLGLLSPEPLPALLWAVYTDLEFCCKCCGDFENAYKYSGMRLELIKQII